MDMKNVELLKNKIESLIPKIFHFLFHPHHLMTESLNLLIKYATTKLLQRKQKTKFDESICDKNFDRL